MKLLSKFSVSLLFILLLFSGCKEKNEVKEVDICIYGGTSAGVIAAYTAKQSGKSVLLIEPRYNLGGMSSGGLGYTDIGNKYVVTGLARDFYRRLGAHYGKLEQWIFEPGVAEGIFNDYIRKAGVEVWFESRLAEVRKNGMKIDEIVLENSKLPQKTTNRTVRAKVFIDCTYEGDLMAKAGVSYTVGREANEVYNETWNGVHLLDHHQFPDQIDPYKIPGDEKSGLIWGIHDEPVKPAGTGDKKVQAYNFRITLTNVPENRIEITQPDNYDPQKYELLIRQKEKSPWKSFDDIFAWSLMPNGKTDINNNGGFSTDFIGMNWNYPDASYDERARIWKEHEDYTKGLLYFVGHDERIPENIRDGILQWGYPKDEYANNNHWTHQMYIREARRMVGETVMTQHHCDGKEIVDDGVGWAAYTMDSHNCDRLVVNGMVKNEGNVEVGGFGPYPVSYKSLTPKRGEVSNLLVPVCLSASHIAYGSIRMEPVFMVLAQSSAVAACQAIDKNTGVLDVDVAAVKAELESNPLADGSTPEILVDNDDKEHVIIQGEWTWETKRGYGPTFLTDNSKGKIAKSIRFIPEIVVPGNYSVYAYFPKLKDISTRTEIILTNPDLKKEIMVKDSDIVVEGQTSGEWVSLGQYPFDKGKDGSIEITNKGADGLVIADAVLFIPERKK